MKTLLASIALLLASPALAQTSDDAVSTIQSVTGLDWSAEGQAQTTLASASDWAKLRKALNAALGDGTQARGNQTLVWEVPDKSSRYADTLSLVLEKTGPTAILTFERRRPVRDPSADITAMPVPAPAAPSVSAFSASSVPLVGANRPED